MKFLRILLGVSLSAILFAIAGAAGIASAAAGGGASCPSVGTLGSFVAADNVSASFSNSGKTTTYTFISLMDENPVGGVPGLVGYCVYPTPSTPPSDISVAAHGFNGALWKSSTGSGNFAFVRPNGDKSNIPLDGKTTVMGTATWSTLPTDQTILLHINDPVVCSSLYPSTSPYTCFVKPANLSTVCNDGDSSVAYNANPFGVLHCPKFALGFEADSVNEFGDRVTLATGGTSTTLNVVFASYGCGDSGHWNTGDCVTTPGEFFTVPAGPGGITGITARIYDPSNLTTPLTNGTVTINPNILFRPSADNTNCPGTGQWFDPLAPVGFQCKNALAQLLTFTFPSLSLSSNTTYVWTVAFDTTHSGYNPIGSSTCSATAQGCGYDALNVGYWFYTGAPYAGTDVSDAEAFESTLSSPLLHATTTWPDPGESGRPLGEIITTP